MAYMDAAVDRRSQDRTADFAQLVEGVRAGTIVAHDRKAYGKWRSAQARRGRPERGLTGAALEQAVSRIASLFPENVIAVSA